MNHLDLCSGIGGFALAASWLELNTVAFCEIDKFCQKILHQNFPDVPIHGDIKQLDGTQYQGRIDIITAGYPCQPFSLAGKQKGHEDPRHLWPDVFGIIQQTQPPWVLCENVAGHVKLGLDEVCMDLESQGYAVEPIIIPASAVQAPHRRERVWIIAYADRFRCDSRGNYRQTGYHRAEAQQRIAAYQQNWQGRRLGFEQNDASSGDATNPLCNRVQGCEQEAFCWQPTLSWNKDCRKVQDYTRLPDLPQPLLPRGDNGLPNRVDRTKGLGNAIVPQVAYQILKAIQAADKEKL